MNYKKAIIKVFGRVQGVFFRHSTKLKAEELGLSGYVRNEIDGAVLIVVEGKTDKINELVKWARVGPPEAQVEDTEIHWEDYKGEFSYFRIE
jgi:acylphosphatase